MNIRTSEFDGIATLEIARPERKNALTQTMYAQLAAAISAADANPKVNSLLIQGQPGIFTAGNDLEDFLQQPPIGLDSAIGRFMQALMDCAKPVIAAVDGAAVGIGATLLLHCDLVVLSDSAQLLLPFVALGLVPEFASTVLLPRRLGSARAAQVLLLGEPLRAAEALHCGIASAVVPAAQLIEQARAMALRFNTLPREAVRDTKRLLRAADRELVQQSMRREAECFAQRLQSPEARAALQAFFQRRRPGVCPTP